ncbi:MAG: cytochrome C oxidase subunit IV family protein [Chloroflexota bacterium]|nr:cytochrome C oxidase subunit IV family protein [Chloroflexota bacterium]
MRLLIVDAVLIVLVLVSVGLAHVDLRGWNSTLALAIAAVQALLIGLYFMELRLAGPLPRLVGAASVVWLGFLMIGTLDDLLTRGWLPVPGK